MQFDAAKNILDRAIAAGDLPGVCFEVGNKEGCVWRYVAGNRSLTPTKEPLTERTRFDMASCTKMMATAMAAFHLIERGELCLSDTMSRFYPGLSGQAEQITVFHLMTHTSGIAPLTSCVGTPRERAAEEILARPLAYETGTRVGYACLGYIVLGRLLEKIAGMRLDEMAHEWVYDPMHMTQTGFCPTSENIAATDINRETGEVTCGLVNDYNARALGGIVGNAGLFSSLPDCAAFARMLLCGGVYDGRRIVSEAMLSLATRNLTPGLPAYEGAAFGLSRGLGFYRVCAPLNPPAELLSDEAYGHTGYTGPTLIVDPKREMYLVLLTSRLHVLKDRPEDIWRIRRRLTAAIAAAWEGTAK